MSNWLIAIVGGAIATVLGGVVLFHLLPQQAPSAPVLAREAKAPGGPRNFKCTMRGGIMDGRVYSFSIDAENKKVVWANYGVALDIAHIDDQRMHTDVKFRLSGWPEHDYIGFNFNRLTMAVEGGLSRDHTEEECPKEREVDNFCHMSRVVVGEISGGDCVEIGRAL